MSPPAGAIDNPHALTVKLTLRVVFPLPLVVLVKVTVSVYGVAEAARLLAPELMDTVTVAFAAGAKVPLAEERLTQL